MTKWLQNSAVLACATVLGMAVGCGGDDDSPPDNNNNGGQGGGSSGSPSNGGSSAGRAGSTSGGRTSMAGSTGDAGDAGSGGSGGAIPPTTCNIYDDARPVETIPVDKAGNLVVAKGGTFTLTSDKTWRIPTRVFVPSGATLAIEPCTLVVGAPKPSAGSIFISRGAKIEADGTADQPIVFSSEDFRYHQNAPWGGIVLLGNAPIGASDTTTVVPERIFEGLTDPRATYGGEDPDDSSGSMSYVRIEFGGDIIAADKEINGLSFGGVGRGTSIHHIMVKRELDDCFEWFGGTVDADHLICENSGDDMFDSDEKFKGHLQFLFGRLTTPGTSTDPNGFEWDGNQPNFTSVTDRGTPQASNATLCGLNVRGAAVGYGAVLRRGLLTGTSLLNTIITGFDHGVDTRDTVGTNGDPLISWTHSMFFGNLRTTINIAEATTTDNDGGFDEIAWITDPASENDATADTTAPEGFDCYADPPAPFPTDAVTGGVPDAPFDDTADFVGAFRDADDNWMTGLWVDWSPGN